MQATRRANKYDKNFGFGISLVCPVGQICFVCKSNVQKGTHDEVKGQGWNGIGLDGDARRGTYKMQDFVGVVLSESTPSPSGSKDNDGG